jgi:2,4-dienoyl-CoA reductase-like NADH-dependent reductase (Old Yellow Enzyme family)
MSRLFAVSAINGMRLNNRFMRAATWEGLATAEGAVTPRLIEMMVSLARGGVGLIISSHSYVSPEGQGTPWQLGVYTDEHVSGLQRMTGAVHQNGGKIMLQLAHAGQYAEEALTGLPVLAVSEPGDCAGKNMKVLTGEDMQRLVACYAQGARRARDAGFDGVEIHAAHGYLLSQFLSPAYNRRQDGYGKAVENRARIHLEIYHAVREVVGKDFPLFIKMNCSDFIDNGLTIDDSLRAAKLFADAGFDAIEVSGGIIRTGKLAPSRPGVNSVDKEAYFKDFCRRFKEEINVPLILVGGVRSFEVAEAIITGGIADYISMSRPLIREPDLILRWEKGDLRKAECKSDNLCFNPGFAGKGISCVTREIEEKNISGQPAASQFS